MLELTTYTELEVAHRLMTAYAQKCRSLHGHRYEVEITVTAKELNEDGMIVDFKKLKEVVKTVLDDKWDHGSCFNMDDPLVQAVSASGSDRVHIIAANPTLEWMVEHWALELQEALDMECPGVAVSMLKASETARNTVTWRCACLPWQRSQPVDNAKKAVDAAKEKEARFEHQRRVDAALRPAPKFECGLPVNAEVDPDAPKEMSRDAFRARHNMVRDLSSKTGVGISECRKVLMDCNWDFAKAQTRLEYLHNQVAPANETGWAKRDAEACQLKERHAIDVERVDVPVEGSKPEDALQEDEEAYFVSYWPVGYPQPISGVIATAMRGVALVRTLKAAVEADHPNGVTLISFNRVPR